MMQRIPVTVEGTGTRPVSIPRRPLNTLQIHMNEQSIKAKAYYTHSDAFWNTPDEGMFHRVSGGRVLPDGYLALPCEHCQVADVIAYLDEDEGYVVPRTVTPGANVVKDEFVLCAACNGKVAA